MEKTEDKRKFTLYLNSDEDVKLKQLKKLLDENTDAKAIIKYQDLLELNKKMNGYLKDERTKNDILERKIKNFSFAFKELFNDLS